MHRDTHAQICTNTCIYTRNSHVCTHTHTHTGMHMHIQIALPNMHAQAHICFKRNPYPASIIPSNSDSSNPDLGLYSSCIIPHDMSMVCLYKYLTTKEKIRNFNCSLLLMEKPSDCAKQHCPQELRSVFMSLWIRPTLFINMFPLGPQNKGTGHDSPLVSNCKLLCISLQENNTKTKVANHHLLRLPIITELFAPCFAFNGIRL